MTTKINNFMKRGTGKRLLVVLLALGLTVGASAQRHIVVGGGGYYYRPAYVGVGFGYGYPYYPYYGLGFGYPYPPYYYGYGATPPRLAYQIQDIKNSYSEQIKETKADKALTHKERRQKIRDLKNARDAAVVQARHDFFTGSQRQYNSNAPQPYKGNDQSPSNQPLNNGKPQSNSNNQQQGNNSNEQPEYSEKGGQ